MPRRVAAVFLLPLLLAPVASVAQSPAPSTASVRAFPSDSAVLAIIRQRVEEKRSAGIVVGLLEPDGRTRVVAYGDPGPGQPPLDGNSVFEIGSISKVFTATVLAELVQEGKVNLDDPVQKYLPSSVHVPSRNGRQITLGSLSEQNSGLPRMPSNFHPANPANPYADYGAQQLYEFLSGYQLTRDPGAQFEYSNLGVGLLGHALSLATGKSYEELERTRVWAPLRMEHTAITLTPWMKAHLALGHDEQGNVVPNWDLDVLAGAGAIRSTANDMLKFADANLHPERGPLAARHGVRAPGAREGRRDGDRPELVEPACRCRHDRLAQRRHRRLSHLHRPPAVAEDGGGDADQQHGRRRRRHRHAPARPVAPAGAEARRR